MSSGPIEAERAFDEALDIGPRRRVPAVGRYRPSLGPQQRGVHLVMVVDEVGQPEPFADGLDLVVPPADRPHRRALERGLAAAGVACNPVAEADGWDLLVHFAALGIGGTVVNGCVPAPDGMAAVPVTDLPVVRYWAAWRRYRNAGRPGIVEHLLRP